MVAAIAVGPRGNALRVRTMLVAQARKSLTVTSGADSLRRDTGVIASAVKLDLAAKGFEGAAIAGAEQLELVTRAGFRFHALRPRALALLSVFTPALAYTCRNHAHPFRAMIMALAYEAIAYAAVAEVSDLAQLGSGP